ncbi:hypothetical protein K488DRAFT_73691 [Vararia minispora EC-137]|uniref:Uncharacterized protein n=1 Tax=Vararia minispora EC-137 TaxID=1314806 RepID=A0ACB8QB93_9AGAM|nr:hypothetical protein K488DRAFT_73691 [Vararia minispora EC-137]
MRTRNLRSTASARKAAEPYPTAHRLLAPSSSAPPATRGAVAELADDTRGAASSYALTNPSRQGKPCRDMNDQFRRHEIHILQRVYRVAKKWSEVEAFIVAARLDPDHQSVKKVQNWVGNEAKPWRSAVMHRAKERVVPDHTVAELARSKSFEQARGTIEHLVASIKDRDLLDETLRGLMNLYGDSGKRRAEEYEEAHPEEAVEDPDLAELKHRALAHTVKGGKKAEKKTCAKKTAKATPAVVEREDQGEDEIEDEDNAEDENEIEDGLMRGVDAEHEGSTEDEVIDESRIQPSMANKTADRASVVRRSTLCDVWAATAAFPSPPTPPPQRVPTEEERMRILAHFSFPHRQPGEFVRSEPLPTSFPESALRSTL